MARITPPKPGEFLSELEDDIPYRATIASIESEDSEYKGKKQTQLVIHWGLDDNPHLGTIREYVGMRLGTQQNGQVSKLRQILNAVAHQPKAKEIAWFDDETWEWSYDGDRPYAKLAPAMQVTIRGETLDKISETTGETKRRFTITGYRPSADEPPPAKPAVRGRPQAKPESASSEEPPF